MLAKSMCWPGYTILSIINAFVLLCRHFIFYFAFSVAALGRIKSNLGWSPLHLASYFGHHDVVELLLKVSYW